MASNKVVLEVELTSTGIKVVEKQIDQVTDSIDQNTSAQDRNAKSSNKLSNAKNRYNRLEKGAAQNTANGSKAFAKQAQTIGGGLVPAYAVLAANIFAIGEGFRALSNAARVEQLTAGLGALGEASGLALRNLSTGLREATGNALSLEEAMRSTALITSAGLDPSSIQRFGEVAKNASIALGRDTADSLARLTRGVTKLEPELLDELGIMVRLDEAVQTYALQVGKSVNQLTNFERRQAFLNATLEQGEKKFGAIGDAVDVSPYDKLAATFGDLSKTALKVVNVVFEPIIGFLASSPTALTAVLTAFAGTIIGKMVPALENLEETAKANIENLERLTATNKKGIIGLEGVSPAVKEYAQQIEAGTKTTKTFNQVLNFSNLSVQGRKRALRQSIDADIDFSKGIKQSLTNIGAYTSKIFANIKSLRASQKAHNVLAKEKFLNVLAEEQLQAANIVRKIQEEDFAEGVSEATASIKKQTAALIEQVSKSSLLAGANAFLTGSFKILGNAAIFTATAISKILPWLTLALAAWSILSPVIDYIASLFKDPVWEEYEKKQQALAEVQKELTENSKELSKGLKGTSTVLTTQTQLAESAATIFSTFSGEFKKLKDAAPVGEFTGLAVALDAFIKENALAQRSFTQFAGGAKTVEEAARKQNMSLEETIKVVEELIQVQGKAAKEAQNLAETVKEGSEAFAKLLEKFRAKTDYDEVFTNFKQILEIIDGINNSEVDPDFSPLQIALENFSDAQIKFFDLEQERANLSALDKLINESKERDAERIASLSSLDQRRLKGLERQEVQLRNRLSKLDVGSREFEAISGYLERNLELQKKVSKDTGNEAAIRAAAARTLEQNSSTVEEQVQAGLKIIDGARQQVLFGKTQIEQQKQLIADATKYGIFSEGNTAQILASEQAIRDTQVNGLQATVDLQKTQIGNAKKLAFNREADAEAIADMSAEEQNTYFGILALLTQIQGIEAQRLTPLQEAARFAADKVKQVEQEQIAAKAVLDIDNRRLGIARRLVESSAELAATTNALNAGLGGGFKESPDMKAARLTDQQFIKDKNDLIDQEARIATERMDLEYDLLEARLAQTIAELEVLKAGGANIKQNLIDNLSLRLEGLSKEGSERSRLEEAIENERQTKRKKFELERAQANADAEAYVTTEQARRNAERAGLESRIVKQQLDMQDKIYNDRMAVIDSERDIEEERLKNLNAVDQRINKRELTASQILDLERQTEEKKKKIIEDQAANKVKIIQTEFKLLEAQLALQKAEAKLLIEKVKAQDAVAGAELENTVNVAFAGTEGLLETAETEAIENVNRAAESAIARLTGATSDAEENNTTNTSGQGATSSNPFGAALEGAASTLDGDGSITEKLQAAGGVVAAFSAQLATLGPAGPLISAIGQSAEIMGNAFQNVAEVFENTGDTMEDRGKQIAAITQGMSAAIGGISAVQQAAAQQQVADIDRQIAAEKQKDGKSKESLAKIAQMEKRKDQIKRKAFEQDKKMKIAQAVMSTASAIASSLVGPPGLPWSAVFAAMAAAMGAAQIAAIRKTSYQGGGSAPQTGGAPSVTSVGSRQSTVDLARSQSASGELAYLRGAQGMGGIENFKPSFTGRYRAEGGATAGYIVGEQGPELFMPQQAGKIVPNDQMQNMSPPTNINISISAIDAQGVEEVMKQQTGAIVRGLRGAANSYGESFLEDIDASFYTPTSGNYGRLA